MAKSYFSAELFVFLRQLKRNNRREWFQKNRSRYESLARDPSLRFITDLRFRLRAISPWLVADPKPNGGSLFRIYRDIRFSQDKKPYKTHVGMNFWHAASNEYAHGAGYYLHLEPDGCFLAGGCWHPDPHSLTRIRDAIAWKADEWNAASARLELEGDTLTRPPRGYGADHPLIEDLKRKDFIASVDLTELRVCSPRFMDDVIAGCEELSPLLRFLSQAVGLQF